ncbi:alpha/beta hydrolase [Caulobacter sp. RHG1]|uniref:alpha/beta hydrolase n=1 Tax=Caulobacter sp. (strain RHG1) TaxID=2545762 RepID=UPI0015573008|nr:alpha/beta hydrolase [Caulobacter sp. RHG1]NQE64896.1 Endo-1,4-beta-xylanase [Caulobacter sp. RHG1]
MAIEPNRRTLLGLTAGLAAAPALARAAQPVAASKLDIFDLWPGPAPGGEKVTVTEQVIARTPNDPTDTAFLHVTRPWLTMRRPVKPNGAAVLLIPGGGYRRVATRKEGGPIDAWLLEQGLTVFAMDYRLPADGWAAGPDVALQDAQRAMRLIRARAPSLGVDPAKVAALGFSAGGHVAARLATQFARETYAPVDAADKLPTRPFAAGLFYPVITMTQPHAHAGSATELLGPSPSDAQRLAQSAERQVPADTPPTFIMAPADDATVPVENSVLMWQALRAQKVPVEAHLFEVGGHGMGLTGPDGKVLAWTGLLDAFFKRHGLYA